MESIDFKSLADNISKQQVLFNDLSQKEKLQKQRSSIYSFIKNGQYLTEAYVGDLSPPVILELKNAGFSIESFDGGYVISLKGF